MSYKNLSFKELQSIRTVGELKQAGYISKSVKEELRDNLRKKLRRNEVVFEGIHGYEHTVVPDVERALLSMHNINFLGLRGQAKTRIARLVTGLLDEWVPVIAGSELNDDPLRPISRFGIELLAEKGEDCPLNWWHRDERYTEKTGYSGCFGGRFDWRHGSDQSGGPEIAVFRRARRAFRPDSALASRDFCD